MSDLEEPKTENKESLAEQAEKLKKEKKEPVKVAEKLENEKKEPVKTTIQNVIVEAEPLEGATQTVTTTSTDIIPEKPINAGKQVFFVKNMMHCGKVFKSGDLLPEDHEDFYFLEQFCK